MKVTKTRESGFTTSRQVYSSTTAWTVGELTFSRKSDATRYIEYLNDGGEEGNIDAYLRWLSDNHSRQFHTVGEIY